ncbi:MAG TPA: hypothetical protein VHW60_02095 [Caulobacteraceae bacterium]|nr:hypothetical protein [Caulobacteraceae bacterium]
MSRLSLAFFSAATLYGMAGMVWGAIMGSTHDFTLAPAHAHLNLLGWVSLSIMAGFYALAGPRAPRRLGWINFAICNVGLLIFISELARLLAGDASAEPVMIVGIAIWLVGMLTFLAAVLSLWTRPKAAA